MGIKRGMKKTVLILILILMVVMNVSAEDLYTSRGSFGVGVMGPFPSTLQLILGPNVEIEIGLYNGLRNLFQNASTIFSSLEFVTPTYNLLEDSSFIDIALGIGVYGVWWMSKWHKNQAVYSSITIGGRLSFILNFSVSKRSVDIFLKAGPGVNIWGGAVSSTQKWELFATMGLRFWIA
ncbi:DUF3996 domain-containing protein [Borrelia sp. BU AG58]|uniref:BAPKO_0422 family outer member beta-barrel protein n=1 Tax=Borrelia sp. BU AG58 TaxID=2887345 RepID=UPI001E415436|nr:DUF3996 domain-containing protein [Borrelia sp. BU AG58]UER67725.1 DUF3996 domain-containing protein [Borrelia sp. BU AG58]